MASYPSKFPRDIYKTAVICEETKMKKNKDVGRDVGVVIPHNPPMYVKLPSTMHKQTHIDTSNYQSELAIPLYLCIMSYLTMSL